jgi:GNAT superfamily N-acetyltransferase
MLERLDTLATIERFGFRMAERGDVAVLVPLYREFFGTSTLPALGLHFDADSTKCWLERVLPNGSPHVLATAPDGRLAGSLNYNLDHNGLVEPYASLDKFYVRPAHRQSGLGRLMLAFAMDAARADGAVAFRAGISSGFGSAVNLFRKCGFAVCDGSVLLERRL